VVLRDRSGRETPVENDVVFAMIGREAPLGFFRRSRIPLRGEWTAGRAAGFAAFVAFCVFLFGWKAGGAFTRTFESRGWFPFDLPSLRGGALAAAVGASLREPGFWYSLVYCLAVVLFGIARIRRRRTPYVARQTIALAAIQVVPLFLLPYVLLPWAGRAGLFDAGFGRTVADHLFPAVSYGQGREYWRAFGLVLAWPLFVWNFFSPKPMGWWLAIGCVQTFVAIPLIVRRWGKGAYCGWICSCGALAETMGDRERRKMPHGPVWNRLNMTGQAILAAAFLLFLGRVISWAAPATRFGAAAGRFYEGMLSGWAPFGVPLNYSRVVDLFLAGIVGVGFYFRFSGRVWCRFACPLAALMHVYARFSRFRIFPEKEKCISCNVCTSVCHQGIDVMSFANKGVPMEDPQCVRCSACVQMCPTGVLSFGRIGAGGLPVLDRIPASPVRMSEGARLPTP
jgi:NAD-dependent dihydropyrimidine dehydrogenase PreA subunit